jgi:hypothetical protein
MKEKKDRMLWIKPRISSLCMSVRSGNLENDEKEMTRSIRMTGDFSFSQYDSSTSGYVLKNGDEEIESPELTQISIEELRPDEYDLGPSIYYYSKEDSFSEKSEVSIEIKYKKDLFESFWNLIQTAKHDEIRAHVMVLKGMQNEMDIDGWELDALTLSASTQLAEPATGDNA